MNEVDVLTDNIKHKLMATVMGVIAIVCGAVFVYLGDLLLNVNLALFHGIDTFDPIWVLDLFFVPFVAGIVVSLIYGLGGKILAHFSPMLVHIPTYVMFYNGAVLPEGTSLLPLGFWVLILIVAVEFSALGGILGEVIIKKTYGRSDKTKLHKKYQKVEELGN